MALGLLELLAVLFILYLVTQIFLPLAFPSKFEKNWMFKSNKNIVDKVETLSNKKANLDSQIDEVINETEEKIKQAESAKELAKKLK